MAFTNGQPWRIQPWNTEQDSETLGPWTQHTFTIPREYQDDFRSNPFANLYVSDSRVYWFGKFRQGSAPNYYKYLISAPINDNGELGDWTSESPFVFPESWGDRNDFVEMWLAFAKKLILTNKINIVRPGHYYTDDGGTRESICSEDCFITRDKLVGLAHHGWGADRNLDWLIANIDENGSIDDDDYTVYPIGIYDGLESGVVFPVATKAGTLDRVYIGANNFYYQEFDKATGLPVGVLEPSGVSKGAPTSLYHKGNEFAVSVVTAKRVYVFGKEERGMTTASAPINDDGSLGEFTTFQIPVTSPQKAIVTSSRIYLFGDHQIWWAPFSGGKNTYEEYSTWESGGSTVTASGEYELVPEASGQGEFAAAGTVRARYDLVLEIRGRGETAADATVAGHYEMGPTVAGRGETNAPTAPTTGRYELLPHAKGRGESAADGTLRAQYDLRPEVRGDAECVETGLVRADYELAPRIAARGLALRYLNPPGIETGTGEGRSPGYYLRPQVRGVMEYAEDDLTRGHVTMPMFECRGKAHVRRRIEGRFDMPMFECRGKVARPAPVGTGRWEHPLFQVAGRASLRMRHEGYGHYVLPVPRRIRGRMLWEDDDWVLRFKRPEVL